MQQQSLMLLHPMVKEKMHLQENTLFDLYLGVKVKQNVALNPLHHVTYSATILKLLHQKVEEEMHLQENLIFDL